MGLTAALNYSIDVRGVYGSPNDSFRSYIKSYVDRLTASNRGLIYIPYERAIKAELGRTAAADCFVTGSSQGMGIDIDTVPILRQFGCQTLANLAVSGGSYEDFLISAGIIADRKDAKVAIVTVSPWMLRSHVEIGWVVEADQYAASRRALGLERAQQPDIGRYEKLSNLFSGSYLRRNLTSLVERRGFAPPQIAEPSAQYSGMIYLPNGSTRKLLGQRRNISATGGEHNIARPFIDPRISAEFHKVLSTLKSRGIQVVLLIPSYHASVFECLKREVCEAFETVSLELHRIAKDLDLPIIGGYDPRPFGLVDEDFSDVLHMMPEGLHKLRRVR